MVDNSTTVGLYDTNTLNIITSLTYYSGFGTHTKLVYIGWYMWNGLLLTISLGNYDKHKKTRMHSVNMRIEIWIGTQLSSFDWISDLIRLLFQVGDRNNRCCSSWLLIWIQSRWSKQFQTDTVSLNCFKQTTYIQQ